MCLLKRMVITQTKAPPHLIHALDCKGPSIGNPETDSNPSNSRTPAPNTNDKTPEEIITVHSKPAVDTETQTLRHTIVQNEKSKRLAQDWREKIDIFESHSAYRDEFLDILAKFSRFETITYA